MYFSSKFLDFFFQEGGFFFFFYCKEMPMFTFLYPPRVKYLKISGDIE